MSVTKWPRCASCGSRTQLAAVLHDVRGHAARLQRASIACASRVARPGGERLVEASACGATPGGVARARVGGEVGALDRVAERPPLGVVVTGDRHPAIVARRRVDAVRRHGRGRVADRGRRPGR